MADWRELVCQRLSGLALDAAEKKEVQLELAAHLEESYEGFCKEGMLEKEAARRALEQSPTGRTCSAEFLKRRREDIP